MFALKVMNPIGKLKGKVAVIVDDMIDTKGILNFAMKYCFVSCFFLLHTVVTSWVKKVYLNKS